MPKIKLKDGSSLHIREAEPADIPVILDLIKELAKFEKLAHEVVATEETLRTTLFGKKRFAEVLIADRNSTPAGFAIFFHNYSTFLGRPGIHLEDLFVQPELRGLGIGQRLLAHLANLAEERECGHFEWSVLDWNDQAIGFYEKLAAKPVKGWTIYRLAGEALRRLAGS